MQYNKQLANLRYLHNETTRTDLWTITIAIEGARRSFAIFGVNFDRGISIGVFVAFVAFRVKHDGDAGRTTLFA